MDSYCFTSPYIYTINGFPYGAFHGINVYRPDWSSEHRLTYTCAIADVMTQPRSPDDFGSISSVPGTFRAWADANTQQAIVNNLLACVAHCMQVHQRTGATIAIALEPEPACMLETVDHVITFFEQQLYTQAAISRLSH